MSDPLLEHRTVPLTGTDAIRILAAAAGYLLEHELHTTKDQLRVFFSNTIVARVYHGSVADATAMLALNATSSRGCHTGDKVFREDTDSMWECVSERGTLLDHWHDYGRASTSEDILFGGFLGETAPSDIESGGDFTSEETDRVYGGTFSPTILGGFF